MAVFSTFFYVDFHHTIYQNIESKLQKKIEHYPNVNLNEIVILDSKSLHTTFKKYVSAESIECVLSVPFGEKTLQIKQDITQEIKSLKFLSLVLVVFNVAFWILATLLWQEKRRLNKDYEIQKQLYSGIAHELKTPLAVIKAKCEVALLKPREVVVYVDVLKENIASVNGAQASIKTLFDLANSEQIEYKKKTNIQKELESIAKDFSVLYKERKFDCMLETQGLEIAIKPTLLKQIIQNFLQNAFKFTPKDKNICLKSYIENGILRIEVLDESCGIPNDLDVFAPFKKGGKKEGMGLGLFLAKRAAKALGGEVTLENRKETQGVIAAFVLKI